MPDPMLLGAGFRAIKGLVTRHKWRKRARVLLDELTALVEDEDTARQDFRDLVDSTARTWAGLQEDPDGER